MKVTILTRSALSPSRSLARLIVAGELVVFQMKAPVHVVNTVGDLISVSHHPQVEGLRKKYSKSLI